MSTGRYSGRPPAIASAIAHVSAVVTPPRGGKRPNACVRGSGVPRGHPSTRSRVAGHTGRPSPQRFVIIRLLAFTSASSYEEPSTLIIALSPPVAWANSDFHFVSPL